MKHYTEIQVPLRYVPETRDLLSWQKIWNIAGSVAVYDAQTITVLIDSEHLKIRDITAEEV